MLKKVYICAPLGGHVEENLNKVRQYTKYALLVRHGSGRAAFLCGVLR